MNRLLTSLKPSGGLRRHPSKVIVVIAGPNPSFDYYLAPLIERSPYPVVVRDVGTVPPAELLTGAFILFCRYLSSRWRRAIAASANQIAGVGLFVDDDIEALWSDPSVPLGYRMRLLRRHIVHRAWLARHCDVLLVANATLATRFAAADPRVLAPVAGAEDMPTAARSARTKVAFHSTSVHAAEHRWLRPIMTDVLTAAPGASFEVIAGWPLSRLWKGLPHTSIQSPLSWPQYRAASRERGADLLLAPLLPSAANKARTWTKRIDAMRLGAALLVTDPDVYQTGSEEMSLGMCVPAEPKAWTAAIRDLVHDPERLTRLRDLNRKFVEDGSASARFSLADL